MSNSRTRIPSPARSMPLTPRRRETPRKSRSVCSPARSTASGRLSCIIREHREQAIGSFVLSPMTRRSVLTDNTDIEEPGRKSWWKDLGENSRDVMEVLKDNNVEQHNIFDNIEILSQEEKRYTLDLPDSSDSESIQSIIIPHRKLFKEKENQPQQNFDQFGTRDTLEKLYKTNITAADKTVSTTTKELFQTKQRSRPVFPAALLDISSNTTASEKTMMAVVETKVRVHNLFNNKQIENKNQQIKRKNMFAKFIASDSEDDLPEIQPKYFALQKKPDLRRPSLSSRGVDTSMASSMDLELDDWQLLPSSTMVDHQLNATLTAGQKPKKARLSKLSEADTGTNSSNTSKNKQLNISSNNRSKMQDQSSRQNTSILTRKSSKISKDLNVKSKKLNESILSKNTSNNQEESPAQGSSILNKNSLLKSKRDDANTSKSKDSNGSISSENNLNNQEECLPQNTSNVTRNSSKIRMDADAKIDKSQNKSQLTINTSQLSKDTRSKKYDVANDSLNVSINKSNNPNNTKDKNKNTKVSAFKNMDMANDECVDELEEAANNEDNELNFSLRYEDDNADEVNNADVTKNKSDINKSNKTINASKNTLDIDCKETSIQNVYTTDKNVQNAYMNDESTEMAKNNKSLMSKNNTSKSVINDENTHDDRILSHSRNLVDEVQNKSQKSLNQSKEIENEENKRNKEQSWDIGQGSDQDNEGEQNEIKNDEKESESEQDEIKNNQEKSVEIQKEIMDSEAENSERQEEDEPNKTDNDQEENEDEPNETDNDQEESEDDQIESDVEINERQEENEDEQNTSQEEIEQNTSQEEMEQNESDIEDQETESEEANKSIEADIHQDSSQENDSDQDDHEQNDSDHENDIECEDANESEPTAESDQNESDQHDEVDQIENTETPNVSHDTTGRNRKKSVTPEAILRKSKNEGDFTTLRGRNTSHRKTNSMSQHSDIRLSVAPAGESMGFSDGTKNSSAEGSGWDSHRTTRKTLRQTFGKDFTPRKSLRALVMEKSAKQRATTVNNESVAIPQANSTEFPEPELSTNDHEMVDDPLTVHEVSIRTRQAIIVERLERAKLDWARDDAKAEEIVKRRLEQGRIRIEDPFKVPARPAFLRPTSKPKPKTKQSMQSLIPLDRLPKEFIEDLKYKPPKRFAPRNAGWLTKRLYKYLETKLEPKYKYKARIRAEKFAQMLYEFVQSLRRRGAPLVAPLPAVETLKHEMARLNFVKTHHDFYNFFHEFMPREVRIKVIPDIVNKIPHPRNGIFSDIL